MISNIQAFNKAHCCTHTDLAKLLDLYQLVEYYATRKFFYGWHVLNKVYVFLLEQNKNAVGNILMDDINELMQKRCNSKKMYSKKRCNSKKM